MDLETFQGLARSVEAVLKAAAIIFAAIWSYKLFIVKRQKYPRAAASHEITIQRLSGEHLLVHLALTIKNIGDVLIEITKGKAWLQQVIPLSEEMSSKLRTKRELYQEGNLEIDWPVLDEARRFFRATTEKDHIEPGEQDTYHFDFVVSGNTEVIVAYSYIDNVSISHRDIGWGCTTYYNIPESIHCEENIVATKKGDGKESSKRTTKVPSKPSDGEKQMRPKDDPPRGSRI